MELTPPTIAVSETPNSVTVDCLCLVINITNLRDTAIDLLVNYALLDSVITNIGCVFRQLIS